MTRDEAARAFAEKMGWTFGIYGEGSRRLLGIGELNCPAPDAPLPEQLEFVGRVAVAIGANFRVDWNRCTSPGLRAVVTFGYDHTAEADDLCHAALLAALAALEAR